eukprot:Amastigsp_a840988_16.p5 type:complete len:111 gc:universal Amastigsp_a840988_16:540-208(-)
MNSCSLHRYCAGYSQKRRQPESGCVRSASALRPTTASQEKNPMRLSVKIVRISLTGKNVTVMKANLMNSYTPTEGPWYTNGFSGAGRASGRLPSAAVMPPPATGESGAGS